MKKSLLALAVLGAFAADVAFAQSSVTLYGTVDLNGRYVKNKDAKRRYSLSQDGINSSQLGFRGIEDLGGGLKAGFTLLAGVNADTGTANSKFWNRRSTVSLFSNAGELRLGRDYVPTFWNETIFDAFGTNGIGSSINVARYVHVRQDNSIGYFLPSNIGGVYGQAMVAASEPTNENTGPATSGDKPGRYYGGRVGFAAGPFDIAVSGSRLKVGPGSTVGLGTGPGDKVTTINVGGSFDFGFLKILGYAERFKIDDDKQYQASGSVVVPFGQSEIHAGFDWDRYKPDGGSKSVTWQAKATYQYNLSKRTAMYATGSYLKNKDDTLNTYIGGGYVGTGDKSNSKAGEIGVRHFF